MTRKGKLARILQAFSISALRLLQNYFLVKLNIQNQKWNVYMRKTEISFKQIYKLTKRFFKKRLNIKKNSQRDRSRKYKDEYSYR
jgi:hypothetical protein